MKNASIDLEIFMYKIYSENIVYILVSKYNT